MADLNPTDASDDPGREELSWQVFGDATRELAETIAADRWSPDLVIAVARGGLTVGGALAYALGVKNRGTINVEFYTGVDARLEVPILLPPSLNLIDITDLDVLIVDDVADTGHTLALVQEVLSNHVGEARTAVLYHKPQSVIAPTYAWKRTDAWGNFPWSTLPPVAGIAPR